MLSVPLTDDGAVLTLSPQDTIETALSMDDLEAALAEEGLVLATDDGFLETSAAVDEGEPEPRSEIATASFELPTVQVSVFSHRGPAVARILASVGRMTVDHRESGEWSLQQFETSEPSGGWTTSAADHPVIELNRADAAVWFEVTAAGRRPVAFWPDEERDTRPVLDVEAIRVPETAEIYRRLLTEGYGSRDELQEIADTVRVDVDAAHRAVIPEALGGVVGAEDRQRAFLAAFGVAPDLIDVVFGGAAAPAGRRFTPMRWWPLVRETVIAGVGEFTPLTRRSRPLARWGDAVRRRPLWGLALALGEFAVGVALTSRGRGAARPLGVLLVIDAVIDGVIWITRIRRSRGR